MFFFFFFFLLFLQIKSKLFLQICLCVFNKWMSNRFPLQTSNQFLLFLNHASYPMVSSSWKRSISNAHLFKTEDGIITRLKMFRKFDKVEHKVTYGHDSLCDFESESWARWVIFHQINHKQQFQVKMCQCEMKRSTDWRSQMYKLLVCWSKVSLLSNKQLDQSWIDDQMSDGLSQLNYQGWKSLTWKDAHFILDQDEEEEEGDKMNQSIN